MCVCMHKYVCTYMYVFMKRPEFHVSCLPLSYVSVTQSRKGRRAHRCCLCTWARLQVSPLPPHWATDLPTVLKTPFYWWNHPPLQPHPVFLLATALSCSMLRTSSQVNFSVGILISQFILTLFPSLWTSNLEEKNLWFTLVPRWVYSPLWTPQRLFILILGSFHSADNF